MQIKNIANIVEAFDYFVQAFPDSPQTPSVLAQRALAYQADKNYDAALADLNTILTKYPAAREREAALQQKALILGQQGRFEGNDRHVSPIAQGISQELGRRAGAILHRESRF